MSLRLDLLRHGEALPAGEGGDLARPLSPAGAEAVRRLGRELSRHGSGWDRAFASPYHRAQQTAEILLGLACPGLEAERLDELIAVHEPEGFLHSLATHGAASGRILLVGHQPLLGRLAGHLLGQKEKGLVPAGLLRIECSGAPAYGVGRLEREWRPEAGRERGATP